VDNATSPAVTRDGKTVIFRRGGDMPGLYRANIDGSGLTKFVEGSGRGENAVILSDDRTVVYWEFAANGTPGLWSVPLFGGPSRQILKQFVSNTPFKVSPDGRVLRFRGGVVNGRAVSMLCDLPDCTNLRATDMPEGQWTPDGRGIAYVDNMDRKNIWVQPIAGGAPHPLTKFTEKDITSFAWSPDGKRLAITRGTLLSDIVLIKGIR
jgi:Tol biopolymer transport system component